MRKGVFVFQGTARLFEQSKQTARLANVAVFMLFDFIKYKQQLVK